MDGNGISNTTEHFRGGAVYINGGNATFNNSTFTNNFVDNSTYIHGGSLYIGNDDSF